MKTRLKHIIEYLLLRVLGVWVRILSYRAVLTFGCLIAGCIFHIFRFRAKEARRRIKEVLCDTVTDRDVKRIAWISWRNLCFNAIEILRMSKRTDIDSGRITFSGISVIKKHLESGRGAIISSIHMGNWEMGVVSVLLQGIPIFSIARRQKNVLTDSYLNKMRMHISKMEVLYSNDAIIRNVIRRLKNGKVLAIMPDLRSKTLALPIHYLGKQANIAAGMATFARQTNVPIFPAIATRKGWTQHHIQFLDPIFADLSVDKQEDIMRLTQTVMSLFDKRVREQPDQYFWFNKRWVLEPFYFDKSSF
ncbi:MAG: hypothetical protein GKR87_16145 [Kiritimatiellae bacterium]|nr:hypothetical protein [Kiritimatiellia bacterium]